MWSIVFASAVAVHPFEFVRVLDPDYPGALAQSEQASVRIGPPEEGVPWQWESVPYTDGWVDTDLLAVTNANEWQRQGHLGAGVKVAVFDLQWFGARWDEMGLGDVQTHDCWAHRSCAPELNDLTPRFSFEEGMHGVACAQVIRAIAPDVDLHLVRVNGQTTLENAVDWAIRENVDLISMSLSFFQRSFYDGTGPFATMMKALEEAGILMVTSSGNYARSHWRGRFTDGDGDGRMDFDGSNRLRVWFREGASRGAYVSWDQYAQCGLTDLSVIVRDDAGHIIGRADSPQTLTDEDEDCEPMERARVQVEDNQWAWLEVIREHGPTAGLEVDIMMPGGRVDGYHAEASIVDPGADPHVLTVGAVDVNGYLSNDVEAFSSQGPVASGVVKPEVAGPDGLSVPAYGNRGFYGTSASTPAVVGLLAQVMSEDPTLSPNQAAERLKAWAWNSEGHWAAEDPRWGFGKARLPIKKGAEVSCGDRPWLLPLLLLPLSGFRRTRGLKA